MHFLIVKNAYLREEHPNKPTLHPPTRRSYFGKAIQSCFMQKCQITSFYLSHLNYFEFVAFCQGPCAQDCLGSKPSTEQLDLMLARPYRAVLCKNAKFQHFIQQFSIYLDFLAFCRGPLGLEIASDQKSV